ncbi:MAG: hypothetical protein ACE5FM_05740 [Methyloligellaceae bacterium]
MTKAATFEATYTRYPFAPLVELGIVIAAWLKRVTTRDGKSDKPSRDSGVAGGAVGHAA